MINLIDFWKWAEVSSDEYAVNGMRGNKEEFEFDGWRFLIDTAFDMITKMQNQTVEENELETFLLIMALDHEREDVLDMLKDKFIKILDINMNALLLAAVGFNQYNARWQIADLLGYTDLSYVKYLKCFINDIHPYVQRRALLSMLKLDKNEAKKYFSCLKMYGDDITRRIIREEEICMGGKE